MAAAIVTEADAIRLHATVRPDHPAIIYRGKVTSYRELDLRSNRICNGLLSLGQARGARVAIQAKNSSAFFELFFGILKAGMTVLPLNWRLSAAEIAFILQDAEVEVLFVDDALTNIVPALQAATPALSRVIVLGSQDSSLDLDHWRNAQSGEDPHIPAKPEEVMIQFYTSGTTGIPKGVQISHRSSRAMRMMEVEAGEDWMQWGPQNVAIVALPNFHLSGTSWALQWLARGATCVVQEQVEADAFLRAIGEHGVTHLFAVPTVIDMMLASPLLPGLDLASLQVIFYGGAPMSAQLLRRALDRFRCDFVQIYGMTENNGTICYLSAADHARGDEALLKSCGRPLPSVSVRILDTRGQEVSLGEVGEICIDSPSLMNGYWKRDDLRGEMFHGKHFRTGDAGYRSAEGYVFLVDRLKDMIVSGGENIYPAEIERALLEHPKIADAAVIGIADARWGEAVKAIVVRRAPALDEQEVIAWVKARIAAYKAPKSVAFIDALPRNANGKVMKRALRDEFGAGKSSG